MNQAWAGISFFRHRFTGLRKSFALGRILRNKNKNATAIAYIFRTTGRRES